MGGKHMLGCVGWVAVGSILALVMPLAAVYTAKSVQVVAEDSAPLMMLFILAIISFAAHVLVLFGGKLAHDAKTYYLFTAKHTRLSNQLAADHRLVRKRLKKFQLRFIPYVHHWTKHNHTYEYVEAGPFDAAVADLLHRHFPHLKKNGNDDGSDHA